MDRLKDYMQEILELSKTMAICDKKETREEFAHMLETCEQVSRRLLENEKSENPSSVNIAKPIPSPTVIRMKLVTEIPLKKSASTSCVHIRSIPNEEDVGVGTEYQEVVRVIRTLREDGTVKDQKEVAHFKITKCIPESSKKMSTGTNVACPRVVFAVASSSKELKPERKCRSGCSSSGCFANIPSSSCMKSSKKKRRKVDCVSAGLFEPTFITASELSLLEKVKLVQKAGDMKGLVLLPGEVSNKVAWETGQKPKELNNNVIKVLKEKKGSKKDLKNKKKDSKKDLKKEDKKESKKK